MVMLALTVMAMVPMLRVFKRFYFLYSHSLTHFISGTAAGHEYGVAKKASIIAVKVLSDEGYVQS